MNTAKKIVIGIAVMGIFVVYGLGIRHQQPQIARPASLVQSNRPTSSTKPSATNPGATASTMVSVGQFKDGSYTGSIADAYYGSVQVLATITGGKISDVKFLQYPDSHDTSVYINQQAMPYLQQEAIQAQSSHVNTVSGATFTSQAFQQSLASALSQANA
ncbi:MAG: FMN-binding protein [Candidatus Saccharimonadales bacterium]